MAMDFKKWILESGTSRGLGGGLVPPEEIPHLYATAAQDYHDKNAANPENPNGALPPVKKIRKKLNKNNGRR